MLPEGNVISATVSGNNAHDIVAVVASSDNMNVITGDGIIVDKHGEVVDVVDVSDVLTAIQSGDTASVSSSVAGANAGQATPVAATAASAGVSTSTNDIVNSVRADRSANHSNTSTRVIAAPLREMRPFADSDSPPAVSPERLRARLAAAAASASVPFSADTSTGANFNPETGTINGTFVIDSCPEGMVLVPATGAAISRLRGDTVQMSCAFPPPS